jgi:hypothetical protein
MSATSRRPAVDVQLATALDQYLRLLDTLDPAASGGCSRQLQDLTDAVGDIRLHCAALPGAQALFVELLIGHSELVFEMGRMSAHGSGMPRRAALLAAQKRRAQGCCAAGSAGWGKAAR